MIPKFRMWNRISSQLHIVNGLYFDDKEAEYVDNNNVLRFIGFKNIELMQSTGLFDKNGKEIFEGDILKVVDKYENNSGSIEVVSYSEAQACFITKDIDQNIYRLYNTLMFEVEVIGNIYENPELLELEE